jgi:hypothetical protein
MELLSLLSGADNLRRLLVILGLILVVSGTIYPLQRWLELKEKEIKIEEVFNVNTMELEELKNEVDKTALVIASNSAKNKKLSAQRDSLLKCEITENVKDKLRAINSELDLLDIKDEKILSGEKSRVLELQKKHYANDSLRKEISNLSLFIVIYWIFGFSVIIIGICLLVSGFRKWKKSQEESDRLKTLEADIKEQELLRIKKENGEQI